MAQAPGWDRCLGKAGCCLLGASVGQYMDCMLGVSRCRGLTQDVALQASAFAGKASLALIAYDVTHSGKHGQMSIVEATQ